MSLVNEALRKARLEASRQHAKERGLPQPPPAFLLPRRRQPLWPWVAAGAVGLLLLAGTGFWAGQRLAGGAAGEEPVGESPAVSRPRPVERIAPADSPTAAPMAEASLHPTSAAARPETVPARTEPERVSPPTAEAVAAPGSPAPQPIEHAAQAGTPTGAGAEPSPAPSAPVRTVQPAPTPASSLPVYLEVADLPEGRIELGGIAWSRSDPHALINGRIVGRGERVEVYTVVEIHPREVELEGAAGSFLLRLR